MGQRRMSYVRTGAAGAARAVHVQSVQLTCWPSPGFARSKLCKMNVSAPTRSVLDNKTAPDLLCLPLQSKQTPSIEIACLPQFSNLPKCIAIPPGMHWKARDLRGGPRSACTGGWRRLSTRLGAVTVGYKCH